MLTYAETKVEADIFNNPEKYSTYYTYARDFGET